MNPQNVKLRKSIGFIIERVRWLGEIVTSVLKGSHKISCATRFRTEIVTRMDSETVPPPPAEL